MTPGAMHASRRLDSQLKAQQVRAAVGALVTAGRPATIAQVAREAGVSRKFIYAHPEPRAEIEHRGLAAAARPGVGLAAQARVSAASLRADAENARARNQRLRQPGQRPGAAALRSARPPGRRRPVRPRAA